MTVSLEMSFSGLIQYRKLGHLQRIGTFCSVGGRV
jgi:hypothetical protein